MKLLTPLILALMLLFMALAILPTPQAQANSRPSSVELIIHTQPFSFTVLPFSSTGSTGLNLDFMGKKVFLELMGSVAVTALKLMDKYEVLKFVVVIAVLLWLLRMLYAFVVNRSHRQSPGVELGDAINVSEQLVEDNNFDDGGYLEELEYVNRHVF